MSAVLVGSAECTSCPVCGCVSDVMRDHLVTCRGNGDMIHMHDSLRNVLYTATQSPPRRCQLWFPGFRLDLYLHVGAEPHLIISPTYC